MKADSTLLTPKEVAAIFQVDSRTVTRWAAAGRLTSVRTLGGHHRYPVEGVQALLAKHEVSQAAASESD